MSTLELTKTKMQQGVWQGVITGADETAPKIEVTHPVSYTHLTLPTTPYV